MMPNRRKKLFSTGEIAAMVDTNSKTVARWIDEGLLKGVALPGMKERRVHRDDVRAFFVKMEYNWAVDELDAIDRPWGDGRGTAAPQPHAAPAPRPGPAAPGGGTRS